MPLIVDPEAFIEGGRRGIKVFEAVYAGFEDDLPNQFDETKLRTRMIFTDVEIITADAPVDLPGQEFDFYFSQSNNKRSTNKFIVDDYEEFAGSIGVRGPALVTLQGGRYRFEKVEYDFGSDNNKAVAYIPTAKAGEAAPVVSSTTAASPEPDALYDFIVEAVGEGSTAATLQSAIARGPAAIRKAAAAAGGGVAYITSLVENGLLDESDGVLTAPAF